MFDKNWRVHAPLKVRLAKERQMMSLMEKEIATVLGEFIQDRENWVRMWVDTGHAVLSDCGRLTAFRGIDFDGTLMWLVRHPDKAHGYHSLERDPHAAIAEAEAAWADRRRVRKRWGDVRRIARELLLGKKRFEVTRADAHRSALCSAGIDAFMARIGLPNAQRVSGRTAALLMMLEPQLGFVIYAAYERTLSERGKQAAPHAQATTA